MRYLLAAAAAGVAAACALLWLAVRDLREPWTLSPAHMPDLEDYEAVQVDPYVVSQPIGGM